MRSLAPGSLVDRYELVSRIGEGGMAEVWVARQKGKHGFEKLFAIKCIHARYAEVPAFRSMFLDEARIASAIEHPNVAQVFDLGEAGSMLYLVMEYVDGESLGALMIAAAQRAQAPAIVPTAVSLRIIADACAGLDAAHRLKGADGKLLGVVHRDVSPQNILVNVRGDVKIIDFGIAHAKDRIGSDTRDGSLKGKLHYMAPEQARHETIGPYTDTFAIGATLYRMLAGRPPFDAGNDAATLHLLLSGAPPPPLPDTVPPLVTAIVERSLSHDPGERYGTAREMRVALEQALEEGFLRDVGIWVRENLSDGTNERRAQLAARAMNIRPGDAAGGSAGFSTAPPAPLPAGGRGPASAAFGTPAFDAELELGPPLGGPLPGAREPRPSGPAIARPVSGPDHSSTLASAAAPPAADSGSPSALELASIGPPRGLPPPAVKDLEERSMMDIGALVARQRSSPRVDPPAAPAPPPDLGNAPYVSPQRQDAGRPRPGSEPPAQPARPSHRVDAEAAPARDTDFVGPQTRARPLAAGVLGARFIRIAAIVTVTVIAVVALLLVLPGIIRARVIAAAQEAGVELTIERVGVGFGSVSLRGVSAKTLRVPNALVHADEIFVTGLSARQVRVRGLELTLAGPLDVVVPSLQRFYEDSRPRFAGSPADPRKVTLVSGHVTWTGIYGEGTQLQAGEVDTELESRGVGLEDIRASVGSFSVKTRRTTFGPWGGTYDRATGSSRIRLLFDPPVPDGPSALVVWTPTSPPHLTLKIARSPITHLGLRPAELGLPADETTELELKLEAAQSPTMRNEASGTLSLFNVRLKGLKQAVDVKLEGGASGQPGRPLDLEKTTMTVGPFLANVTGTVQPTDLGFRLDATWRTQPVACEKLARSEAKAMGPFAAALQDIGRATGIARVTGTANASGVVKYDTRTPDDVASTLLAREACGLSIFGM
ncbi:MAG: hypothetical protein JWP97_1827 [Labilithrix sp.]|nr:hypothetical protein [Labilithrix sp.]